MILTLPLIAALAGIAAGAILFALNHLAPKFGAGRFVRDLDTVCILGHDCSGREAHLIGVLLHFVLSAFFGAAYAVAVGFGMVMGYAAGPLLMYAIILTVVMGGVVMPLQGHGLFGMKEDAWFPVDLLLTNVMWVALFGVLMNVLT
jgi:hypothetical protein